MLQRRSFALDADVIPSMPDWLKELAESEGIGSAKDKADKDAIWVGELTDDLTVAIALREWEKAASLVEQGKRC